MSLYFVYILKCVDDSYYVGYTNNVARRMQEHQRGLHDSYTSIRLPTKLVFIEEFSDEDEAFLFERQIKKWSRKKKEALIEGNFEAIKLYSKKQYVKKSIHPE